MTQETEREAYRIEGNTIHKNPVDLGGGKWGVGFPIYTVSEYADVETVKAIFEENEARARVGRGEVGSEVKDALQYLSFSAPPCNETMEAVRIVRKALSALASTQVEAVSEPLYTKDELVEIMESTYYRIHSNDEERVEAMFNALLATGQLKVRS